MKRLRTVILLFVAGAVTAALAAAPSLSGTWTMTVEGTPHGTMAAALKLTQDGTRVSGTFSSGHTPDMALTGEFVDGGLKLESAGDGDEKFVFTGKLKEDGTLAGLVSTSIGDMRWTASRAAGKDRK